MREKIGDYEREYGRLLERIWETQGLYGRL